MKKLFVGLMLLAMPLMAQDTTMITVPKSSLTASQLAEAKAAQLGHWAGLGKEIGEAVNSSLSAVTDQTSRFADTKIGKITTAVVIWKVIGNNILGIAFALIILFCGFPVLIWSYRKYTPHNVLSKVYIDDKGKKVKEYKLIDQDSDGARGLHALAAGVLLAVMAISLFAS